MRKLKPNEFLWNDTAVERLKALWAEGLSASAIAAELGGGITRNSVIGKLHRLGLSGPRRWTRPGKPSKPSPPRKPRIPQMRTNKRPAASPPPAAPSAPPAPPAFSYSLLDLKHGQCRWPSESDRDYRFCGAQQAFDSSYCSDHLARSLSSHAPRVVA